MEIQSGKRKYFGH